MLREEGLSGPEGLGEEAPAAPAWQEHLHTWCGHGYWPRAPGTLPHCGHGQG